MCLFISARKNDSRTVGAYFSYVDAMALKLWWRCNSWAGPNGFKPMSGFVFAATIVAAQSDCSISTVYCHVRLRNLKQAHFRIIIFIELFIAAYQRVT